MTRVVIAGGGIAGLATAFAINRRGPDVEVLVLERSGRTGGNIRTEQIDGYTCESGPDGFLDNAPATLKLVDALGLRPRLLPSSDSARKRYILRRGRLHEVPTTPGAFVRTPLLSLRGKLRIAWEPFALRSTEADESIDGFASRRIGAEAASVLVGSMVSGVFAGDAKTLSLRACFPTMSQLEEEHGGLFRALLARRRSRPAGAPVGAPSGRLTSFTGGMSDLIGALTRELGPAIRTSTSALELRGRGPDPVGARNPSARRYALLTSAGEIEADAVVLAGPAAESGAIVRKLDPALASLLSDIPTAPLAVVCLGYDTAAIAPQCSLDGFGFLVAPGEPVRILGALWETSIYPHRAPENKTLLRIMVGGARDSQAVALDDPALLGLVRRDLAATMGLRTAPVFARIVRHPRGIPQYVQGHLARMRRADTLLQAHPGLFLAGNSYRGVSINACVAEADRTAETVLRSLATAWHDERVTNAAAG
jgi:oxygen-dependent protoporphyrinogen oxidase